MDDGKRGAGTNRNRFVEEGTAVYLRDFGRHAADLDAVIRGMPDAVYVGDERGISVCNDAALLMLGCKSLVELEGDISDLFERLQHRSPETGERVPRHEEPFARALAGETVVEDLVVRNREVEEDATVRCTATPIHHEGEIVGAVAVDTDLTDDEAKLVESTVRVGKILESITDAFWAVDREWRFTYVNERALGTMKAIKGNDGLTREDVLGKNAWDIFPEVADTMFDHKYREALREQRPTEFEAFLPPEGPWFEVRLYPSEQGLSAYYRDVTGRKEAEEELRQSEVFARSTLNSLSAHIAILDDNGRIVATNRAWQRFVSSNPPISERAGPGTNYLEICDAASGEGSEEAHDFARGIRDVISGRVETFELEYPCHSPEEKRWFVGRVTRFPDTSPPRVVVAHEDVTERRVAEEEARLRAGQQDAVAGLGRRALSEPDLQILLDEAAGLVARTLSVKYCAVLELLPDGDELLLRAGVGWETGLVGNATEETGTGSQAGYTLLSDEPVILEDLASETRFERTALLLHHGVVSGMSAVVGGERGPFGVLGAHTGSRKVFTNDDVNFLQAVANVLGEAIEWRKAEEGMREIREAERGRMARDLHDGPLQDLTYALTAAQLAQSMTEDPNLERWLERTVEALKRTGRELRTAVYDLRLEEESGRPFPDLVRSLVELNRRMSPDRNIRLWVAEGLPGSLLGSKDPELLRILQEALTNTRRHSGARNVSVCLGIDEGKVWADVEDDGRGFEAGAVSGVGLKSMRERARALGGNLEIESEPGQGTRVRFTVTRDRAPEGRTGILLVEDHASFRDAATTVFEREPDFEVVGQAGSLGEAREMIDGGALAADVAIIDLGLPDGYGGDLIKDLHENDPHTQALVVSAVLDRAEMARAVEAGAAGVLHKSVGMQEVIEAVRRVGAGEMLIPLEEVVELLRLAGHQREEDRGARRAVARLTPRELEVLRVLAEGLDGKEIAERLGISGKTERNHMASITEKLGVHSRLQALVFALRYGVVDPPQSDPQKY